MKHSGRSAKRQGAWRVPPRHPGQAGPSDQDVLIRLAAMRVARQRGEVAPAPAHEPEAVARPSVGSAVIPIILALLPLGVGLVVILMGSPAQRPLGW